VLGVLIVSAISISLCAPRAEEAESAETFSNAELAEIFLE